MTTSRWRARAVLACMALLLTSCGDDGPPKAADTTGNTTSAAPSTSASVTTATTDPARSLVTLTPTSFGELQLGMSLEAATATGMVEAFGPGCELAGPDQKAAELSSPLDGSVLGDATNGITTIYVRASVVTSPGEVKIGDPLASAQAALAEDYDVTVDKAAAEMFGDWFVYVSDRGADEGTTVFGLTVAPDTGLVSTVAIPAIPTCE